MRASLEERGRGPGGRSDPERVPVEPGDTAASPSTSTRACARSGRRRTARPRWAGPGRSRYCASRCSTAVDPVTPFSMRTPTGDRRVSGPCRRCGASTRPAARRRRRGRGAYQPGWARRMSSWWTKNSSVFSSRSSGGRAYGDSSGGPLRTWSTSYRERPAADPAEARSVGPGQRRDSDPGRGGAALAQDQVHEEVLDRPPAAQGRLVRADAEGGVTQGAALGLRETCHRSIVGWSP